MNIEKYNEAVQENEFMVECHTQKVADLADAVYEALKRNHPDTASDLTMDIERHINRIKHYNRMTEALKKEAGRE